MRTAITRGLSLLILLTVLLGACSNPFFTALLGKKETPGGGFTPGGTGKGVFVPVTGITGVPARWTRGIGLTLTGTIEPAPAGRIITWSVKDAGTTGAQISGDTLLTAGMGTAALRAVIADGVAEGTDYIQDFDIEIVRFEMVLATPDASAQVTITGDSAYSHTNSAGVWPGVFPAGRTVILSPFKMAKYETTYELWYEVKEWAAGHGYTFANPGREGKNGTDGAAPTADKQHPVTEINWWDAIVWCNAYSEMDGKTLVYKRNGTVAKDATEIKDGDKAEMDMSANGYRLPTRAEWEYAARGGGTPSADRWAGTNVEEDLGTYAWYKDNAGGATHPVGGKRPNRLGLYDMSGNVREWCWDWLGKLATGTVTDPAEPTERDAWRAIQHGDWDETAPWCAVSIKDGSNPNGLGNPDKKGPGHVGFRVVYRD